jgi:hypothetical protein
VTGHVVALNGDTVGAGGSVWFGGGKLAADLSLPRLRSRWGAPPAGASPDDRITAAERNAIWEHAARTGRNARDQIRYLAVTDPAAASDAAYAASDTLHAAAGALGSRVVRRAADAYAGRPACPTRGLCVGPIGGSAGCPVSHFSRGGARQPTQSTRRITTRRSASSTR